MSILKRIFDDSDSKKINELEERIKFLEKAVNDSFKLISHLAKLNLQAGLQLQNVVRFVKHNIRNKSFIENKKEEEFDN